MATSQPTSGCHRLWCPPKRPQYALRGNKLIKAIIVQMVCALLYSKAVSDRAQHLVATGENGEKWIWGRLPGVKYEAKNVQVHINSDSSWPYHVTPLSECVCVFICLLLWVHRKSWGCFKWPPVCACNPWALILRTCCCLSAVCWPKELSHNQGVKC